MWQKTVPTGIGFFLGQGSPSYRPDLMEFERDSLTFYHHQSPNPIPWTPGKTPNTGESQGPHESPIFHYKHYLGKTSGPKCYGSKSPIIGSYCTKQRKAILQWYIHRWYLSCQQRMWWNLLPSESLLLLEPENRRKPINLVNQKSFDPKCHKIPEHSKRSSFLFKGFSSVCLSKLSFMWFWDSTT